MNEPEPNNRCVVCGRYFYWWYHATGAVCPECSEKKKEILKNDTKSFNS